LKAVNILHICDSIALVGCCILDANAGLIVPKIWLFVYISVNSGMILIFYCGSVDALFVNVEAPSC